MKKISPCQKIKIGRHLRACQRRAAKGREKTTQRRLYSDSHPAKVFDPIVFSKKYPNVTIQQSSKSTAVLAPKIMRLGQNNDEIIQFLNCLREIISHEPRQLRVDFTTIETLSPLCAMLLATEIHRWKLTKKRRMRVIDSDKWKPGIQRLLVDIGIFRLIPVVNPYHSKLEKIETDEKFITLRSAQLVDLEKAVKEIGSEVASVGTLLNDNPFLYGGIEEAITNVLQWAYKFDRPQNYHPKILNRWWFLASYNTRTKRITIMVYDHGLGIPKTLPTSKWQENFRKWMDGLGLKDWKDHEIIEAAMKFPRSASGEAYRAKGLRKMKELLAKFTRGTLFIYSGYGEYQITKDGVEKKELHKHPIGGTLIVWEVYMDKAA